MKSHKEYHENLRKELWMQSWICVAGSNTCLSKDVPSLWADVALQDFDKRFPMPIDENIDNELK